MVFLTGELDKERMICGPDLIVGVVDDFEGHFFESNVSLNKMSRFVQVLKRP